MELVCPAGSLPALKAAVDHGADCVYLGFRDATNARNFAGLNFDEAAIEAGIRYAHDRGRKVFVALNTYPQAAKADLWQRAVDRAAHSGVDAVILADPGMMAYAVKHQPQLRLHLSVQGSATNYEALDFYYQHFGIARAVLPRVLSLTQVEQVLNKSPVEIEVFGTLVCRNWCCVFGIDVCTSMRVERGGACDTHARAYRRRPRRSLRHMMRAAARM